MTDEPELPDRARSGSETLVPVPARLPEEVVEYIDEKIEEDEYDNRSEAVRELLEERIRSP
jgi:metal-responsive CopG/Arc/MetJ family transcriptional regulator